MAPETIFGIPTRHEGDPERVAVLLPGAAYVPARPLLHYARAVLVKQGWSVREVWWDATPSRDPRLRERWVLDQARAELDAEKAERVLVVGKSLGSLAVPLAAERGLPAIWLTPLLHLESVVAQLRRSTAPTLLVGGTADIAWSGEVVRELGHPYVEIPGADHGIESEDPVESARMLTEVTAGMSRFVEAL